MVAALGAAADLATAAWVNDQVEAQVVAKTSGAVGVEAHVGSFGWLPRLLVAGEVRESSVSLQQVRGGEIRFTDVRLHLTSTAIDRSALLGGDGVEVRSVERARLEFALEAAELSRLTRLDVTVDDGAVSVTAPGRTVRAEIAMDGGSLVLRVPPLPAVNVPLPALPLVPCQPDVEAGDGAITFSCVLSPVPPALLDLLSRRQASTS